MTRPLWIVLTAMHALAAVRAIGYYRRNPLG